MTSVQNSANTAGTVPTLNLIEQDIVRYNWFLYQKQKPYEQTVRKWLQEAQIINPEAYKGLDEVEYIPTEILADLYPEVPAFGANGAKVVQILQAFQTMEHHIATNKSEVAVIEAFTRLTESVNGKRWNEGSHILPGPDSYGTDELQRREYLTENIASQLYLTSNMKLTHLHNHSSQTIKPLLNHVVLKFAIQTFDASEDVEAQKFTLSFNQDWENFRTAMANTSLKLDIPRLLEDETRR